MAHNTWSTYWATSMLELGVGADILRGIGLVFWGVIGLALWLAATKPKSLLGKVVAVLVVLGVLIGPLVPGAIEQHKFKQRQAAARAVFDERCKTAGEVIHRRIEGVEAVYLPRIRRLNLLDFDSNPLEPGAAVLRDASSDDYIKFFLYYEDDGQVNPVPDWPKTRGIFVSMQTSHPGYRYVVAPDEDGKPYRYTLTEEGPMKVIRLNKTPHEGSLPAYSVDFEDWVDPEIRRTHWVAGTTIKVLDTQTKEVLASKTVYAFARSLGVDAGRNSPWGLARVCPTPAHNSFPTRSFVDQVLIPLAQPS